MAYKEKSEAKKYNNEYNKKAYDRINFTVPKGQREAIQEAARLQKESTNTYIYNAIVQRMKRDIDLGELPTQTYQALHDMLGVKDQSDQAGGGSGIWKASSNEEI